MCFSSLLFVFSCAGPTPQQQDRVIEFAWRTIGQDTVHGPNRTIAIQRDTDALVERISPLLYGATGQKMLVGCFGWLLDLVMQWTGDPAQPYGIVNNDAPQWSGNNATYDDVKTFIQALKAAGHKHGVPDLMVGFFFVGWSSLYDLPRGPFSERHPELYTEDRPGFRRRRSSSGGGSVSGSGRAARGLIPPFLPEVHAGAALGRLNHVTAAQGMAGDSYPYAAQKGGAREGQSFFELWGKQWGNFSSFMGADAVVLRDGFSTYTNYNRLGPYGSLLPPNSNRTVAHC